MITNFKVDGMHCNSCVALIKMELEENKAVKEVKGDFQKGSITVDYDDKKTNINELKKGIEEAGYKIKK
ncbi:MAG: heavy-metal-associated domain-containing protein [archaeon]|jgi:copper chaperone CopZ